jgi:hypothetical protein
VIYGIRILHDTWDLDINVISSPILAFVTSVTFKCEC